LRFDRDRRGYEITALVQPAARGRGKRLLYWFRTPPGVRVGRAPIDETAIRLLEEHNPDVQFDWTRILKAAQPEAPARRDAREVRDRDQRGRREPRAPQRERGVGSPQAPSAPRYTPPPSSPLPGAFTEAQIRAAELAHQSSAAVIVGADTLPQASELTAPTPAETPNAHELSFIETAGAGERPNVEDSVAAGLHDAGSASLARLGAEGLVRLRARYAEVLARIAEHTAEDDVREELKSQAERLNPDAWVTGDEVTAALERYETVFEQVRGVVGRHSPRRRPRE
jgi:hypothetical protein